MREVEARWRAAREAGFVLDRLAARAGNGAPTRGAGRDRCPLRLRPLGRASALVDQRILGSVRLGIADHFGWAVAVTASSDYEVVDRRRIPLIEPGMPTAPIEGCRLDIAATVELVARVRAS